MFITYNRNIKRETDLPTPTKQFEIMIFLHKYNLNYQMFAD